MGAYQNSVIWIVTNGRTLRNVSAVSKSPVRRKCIAMVRSRALFASGDVNNGSYDGSGLVNFYEWIIQSVLSFDMQYLWSQCISSFTWDFTHLV